MTGTTLYFRTMCFKAIVAHPNLRSDGGWVAGCNGYPLPVLGGPDQSWRSGPFAVGHTVVSKARVLAICAPVSP
jgi:hypothetical protein